MSNSSDCKDPYRECLQDIASMIVVYLNPGSFPYELLTTFHNAVKRDYLERTAEATSVKSAKRSNVASNQLSDNLPGTYNQCIRDMRVLMVQHLAPNNFSSRLINAFLHEVKAEYMYSQTEIVVRQLSSAGDTSAKSAETFAPHDSAVGKMKRTRTE